VWNKVAHFMGAKKQPRDRQWGPGKRWIPSRCTSTPCDPLHPTRPHLLIVHSAMSSSINSLIRPESLSSHLAMIGSTRWGLSLQHLSLLGDTLYPNHNTRLSKNGKAMHQNCCLPQNATSPCQAPC
jgi:hypothetical protein